MKTLNKVQTRLPGFSGFYGSVWEDCGEENEIEDINYQRKEKGLEPITYDDCEWDYAGFHNALSEDITQTVGEYLKKHGFIGDYEFEKLSSPKEYNFANDTIHVTFILNDENEKTIRNYLKENKDTFEKYLEDHYTSYSGFFSSYSNNVNVWMNDDYMTHKHKLGAVLNFILENHLKTEENIDHIEMWLYEESDNNQIFASLDFSFEQLYQSIRRSYRFGQKKEVHIYIITTDTMENVVSAIREKEKQFHEMQNLMVNNIHQLNKKPIMKKENKKIIKEDYTLINGDCVAEIKNIPDESISLSVFSPPFADLYCYSDSIEDMGNSKDYKEFMVQFTFLVNGKYKNFLSYKNLSMPLPYRLYRWPGNNNGRSSSYKRYGSSSSGSKSYGRVFTRSNGRLISARPGSTAYRRGDKFVARTLGNPMAVTERKYYDSATSLLIDTSTTSWLNSNVTPASHGGLCLPAQGTNGSQRIGRSIKLCNLRISGCIHSDPLNDSASIQPTSGMTIRIILALDKQPNGAAPTVTDYLTSTTASTAMPLVNNQYRFKTLGRIVIPLNSQAGVTTAYNNQSQNVDWYYKFKKPLEIRFNGNAGTVADVTSNNIHLIAGAADADDIIAFNATFRIRFTG